MDEGQLISKFDQMYKSLKERHGYYAGIGRTTLEDFAKVVAKAHEQEMQQLFKYAYHLASCCAMTPLAWKVVIPCDCGYVEWYEKMTKLLGARATQAE